MMTYSRNPKHPQRNTLGTRKNNISFLLNTITLDSNNCIAITGVITESNVLVKADDFSPEPIRNAGIFNSSVGKNVFRR